MRKVRFLLYLFAGLITTSCHINKGYEAFEVYNYFEAKKQFYKALKNDQSPAAYGLSLIYFRNDNPFHDMDSAYHYSLLSVESYGEVKEKKQLKWLEKLDYNLQNALSHRIELGEIGLQEAKTIGTPDSYDLFISKYPWSVHVPKAIGKRDSIAFKLAKQQNKSGAIVKYIQKYPESALLDEAQSRLYDLQYQETVKEGNTQSYIDFIQRYPDNPNLRDAHYKIYAQETKDNSIASYDKFIRRFSSNPFLNEAWTNLYRLWISDYKKENIESFKAKYTNFPFPKLIEEDLELVGENLYVFLQDNKYGFINDSGYVKIEPQFDYVEPFVNGLAVAVQNEKYGYVDKKGNIKIDFQYEEALPFKMGRAIVIKDDLFGMINVIGNYVLEPIYHDIGDYSDGLIYTESDEGFSYHTLDGSLAFSGVFQEAFSFQNGIAKVKTDDAVKFINKQGDEVISILLNEGDLSHFYDTLFIHEYRNRVDLISPSGSVLEGKVDKIGPLSENRAIIELDGYYGFINKKGEEVIAVDYEEYPNYYQFAQFQNGHSLIRKGGKYGLIDSLGKRVIPSIFSGIGMFGELIPVTKGNKWGFADKDVRLKIPYNYDYAYEFVDGSAIVEKESLLGLIDIEGKEIIPIQFESISKVDTNLFLVKENGLFGLYKNSDTLVGCNYERIEKIEKNLFRLVKLGNISYFDVSNERLITLKEEDE